MNVRVKWNFWLSANGEILWMEIAKSELNIIDFFSLYVQSLEENENIYEKWKENAWRNISRNLW